MNYSPIACILATTLALQFVPSRAIAAPEKVEKHTLSEWKIGSVLFGEKLSKSDMKGKVVVIENWGVKKVLKEGAAAESKPAATPSGPLIASRAWTNAQGQQIKAAVKSADDAKAVFQMANGKLVDYELSKLSDESREVIAAAVKTAKGSAASGDEEVE